MCLPGSDRSVSQHWDIAGSTLCQGVALSVCPFVNHSAFHSGLHIRVQNNIRPCKWIKSNTTENTCHEHIAVAAVSFLLYLIIILSLNEYTQPKRVIEPAQWLVSAINE